jgi:hypothetical protein
MDVSRFSGCNQRAARVLMDVVSEREKRSLHYAFRGETWDRFGRDYGFLLAVGVKITADSFAPLRNDNKEQAAK